MGIRVSVSVDTKALDELAERFADVSRAISAGDARAMRIAEQSAAILVGNVREAVLDSASSKRGYSGRTGALARSFRETVSVTGGMLRIAAESDLVYARIQDQGGFIRPKTVKRLAIPLIPMAVGKWPRHWARGKLFRRGNALSTRPTKGAEPINVYALAKQVRIPAKRYLKKATEKALPRIAKFMAQSVVREFASGQ
jgi:hypothetical protein